MEPRLISFCKNLDAIAKNSMSWMALSSSIQFFTTAAFMLHQRRQYQPLSYKSHFLSHFFVWISLQVFKICSNRPQNVSKMSLKGLLISNRPFLSFLGFGNYVVRASRSKICFCLSSGSPYSVFNMFPSKCTNIRHFVNFSCAYIRKNQKNKRKCIVLSLETKLIVK